MSDLEDGYISFAGIDPAVVVHALYRGTRAVGLGVIHDRRDLSLDEVRASLMEFEKQYGSRKISIDYLFGRPLKLKPFDMEKEVFFYKLYDRDAGSGRATAIIKRLRAESSGR